jgi:tetratricopeptide (TPR) repeat protein
MGKEEPSSASGTLPPPHSPLLTRLWTFLPLALLLATTFFLAFFEVSDYDVWYHLKTGELIPERGVPQKDWFSFKSEDEDWIDVHWGFQRVVAVLYERFGPAGLVWMKSVAAVLAMALVVGAYRKGWPRSVQVLAWIFPLLLMSTRFYERPEIVTLVFTAIFLNILFHAEEHPAGLWVLPFVQVAWANVQGLFVFGPILLGMYWAEAVLRVDRVRGLFRHLMPVTLLVFAACVASPYGWRNLLLVMQISQTATTTLYRDSIAELKSVPAAWREGGYTEVFMWIYVAVFALSAVTTVIALPVIWRERRLFRLLPPIAFAYVGLQAIRNGNHFALVAGTVASWNLGSLHWKPRSKRPIVAATLIVGGLFYAVASEHWHDVAAPVRALGTGEREHYYPREAMRKAGLPGMPMRALVMHNGHAALYEYMNYRPDSPRKTFADARLEVHSLRTYKEYVDLCTALRQPGGAGEATLQRENVDLVAADGDQYAEVQAAMFNNPDWSCIHFDEITAVFLRSSRKMPDGVEPWDAKEFLFRQPAPLADLPLEPPSPPRWLFRPPPEIRKGKDDLLTVRAGYVWEKMANGDYAPPEKIRLWNMIQLQAARRAAARRPWRAESYRQLGYAALGFSRPGVTIATATELPDIVPIATAMFNFKQTLKVDPTDFYARFWLGQTLMNLGEFDLAEREFVRLKSAWPRDRQQVKVLAPGGQLDQLIEDVRKRRQSAGDRPAANPADEWYEARRGLLRGEAVDVAVSVENYHLNLAGTVAANRVGNALSMMDANAPTTPQLDWLRAWLAIQCGDRDTAREAVAAGKYKNSSPTTRLALDQLEQMVK